MQPGGEADLTKAIMVGGSSAVVYAALVQGFSSSAIPLASSVVFTISGSGIRVDSGVVSMEIVSGTTLVQWVIFIVANCVDSWVDDDCEFGVQCQYHQRGDGICSHGVHGCDHWERWYSNKFFCGW